MKKKVIAVLSGKGGVGKSTLAVNIASSLSIEGASTLLIDCDFYNPCVFFHLGMQPLSVGLQDILEERAQIEDTILVHPLTGLRCISASLRFYRDVSSNNLPKLINNLDYDFIIIDCSPGFAGFIEDVVKCSNELFILMTPDVPSVTAAMKMTSLIRGKTTLDKLHLVLNRVTNSRYELHPREIESFYKSEALDQDACRHCSIDAIIPEDPHIPKSIAQKTPIVILNPSSPSAKVFRQLTKTIYNPRNKAPVQQITAVPQPDSGGGILSRLFRFLKGLLGR